MKDLKENPVEIAGIQCNNGESFWSKDYEIHAVKDSGFMVQAKTNSKLFVLIPVRCVDRVWMEFTDADDKTSIESKT